MDVKLNKIYKKVYNVLSNIYNDFYINESNHLKSKNPEIYTDISFDNFRSLSNKDNLFNKTILAIVTIDRIITCIFHFRFYKNNILVIKDINVTYVDRLNVLSNSNSNKIINFCIQEWYPDIEKVKATYV